MLLVREREGSDDSCQQFVRPLFALHTRLRRRDRNFLPYARSLTPAVCFFRRREGLNMLLLHVRPIFITMLFGGFGQSCVSGPYTTHP
jgi:hypothetical protein